MNNLMYLRDACFELTTTDIPPGVRDLVSSWLGVQYHDFDSSSAQIQVLHPFACQDAFVSSVFAGEIIYYSTAFIGRVRFTTSDYARNKVADDSNIIFKTGNEKSFGRIRRIFQVNRGETLFYVDVVQNLADFRCTTSGQVYHYSGIQTGVYDDTVTGVFLKSKHIIEKCVFYERDDRVCTFSRYPSLQGSL